MLPRRTRLRLAVFVAVCFIGGATLASAGAYQLGILGNDTATQSTYLERANRALENRRWNQPPGDNVKDITDEGLAKHPNDTELISVRRRAADELVNAALGKKYGGDVEGALELANLANELAPGNTTAQHLVRELQELAAQRAPVTPVPDEQDAGRVVPKSRVHRPGRQRVKAPPTPSAQPPASAPPATPPSSTGPKSTPAPSSTSGRWL